MPSLSQKKRENDSTVLEQDTLNALTAGKTLPSEYIPAVNVGNYIDPDNTLGNANLTGIYGSFDQTGIDNVFGGTGKVKPSMIYGNSAQAGGTNGVTEAVITNQGDGYSTIPTVSISGDGTGAVATANISGGKVVSLNIISSGQDYTNAVITISGGGGNGASANPLIGSGKISDTLIYSEPGGKLSKLDIDGQYIGAIKAGRIGLYSDPMIPLPATYPNSGWTLFIESNEITIDFNQVNFEVNARVNIETDGVVTDLSFFIETKLVISQPPYLTEEPIDASYEYLFYKNGTSGRNNLHLNSLDNNSRATTLNNKFKFRLYGKIATGIDNPPTSINSRGGQIIWKAYPNLES